VDLDAWDEVADPQEKEENKQQMEKNKTRLSITSTTEDLLVLSPPKATTDLLDSAAAVFISSKLVKPLSPLKAEPGLLLSYDDTGCRAPPPSAAASPPVPKTGRMKDPECACMPCPCDGLPDDGLGEFIRRLHGHMITAKMP
jgi:hypothetical protein